MLKSLKKDINIVYIKKAFMRVMICVPGLPVELEKIKGGVHSATINLLNGFRTQSIQVRVVVLSREVNQKQIKEYSNNITMTYYPEGPFRYHTLNYLTSSLIRINKEVKEFKPDIIHYEEGNSFLLTRLLRNTKKPFLQTIHGMSTEEAKRKKNIQDKITWYFNGMIQRICQPKNIIHLSTFSLQLHKHLNIEKETIIPNAIKNEYFNIPQKDKTYNTLVYIGIIDHNKNLIYLLQTLSKLKKAGIKYSLNVIGGFNNQEYKNTIEKYISDYRLGEQIQFHGWITQTEVMKVLEQSDILVVCSQHESLPMVIAESMAAGKTVIASAVGGIPEMIDHDKNGYLFKLAEPTQLANILTELHGNDEKIKNINTQARIKASRYHNETVAKETILFYKQLLDSDDYHA
jgi:glycosyltransferase involved in cell wall biosynthesis